MKQNYKYTCAFVGAVLLSFALSSFINSYCQAVIAQDAKNKSSKTTVTKHATSDWRKQSKTGAIMIEQHKYTQANELLASLVPQARREAPDSLEFGILLLRYGVGLYANKKYAQSLPVLQEALKIVRKAPNTKRQEKAIYQILGPISAAHLKLHQFNKAEQTSRTAIAYSIAFPNIASQLDVKKSYAILRMSLENQKKTDEAALIAEIFNSL
jgi:tetratricopeptide (TPR) repeat protein